MRETENGTPIEPGQVAIVIKPDGTWQMVLPQDEDAAVPQQAIALIAAAMRLTSDAAFYREMLAWYAERHGGDQDE
ncbi:MAG: hypothetical protein L0Z50_18115 [Verrucomicrobiales bacterium]|nr:hypothetical protein [Verrucomicrobiales bacterium]